jgi:hypothetical protein
MKRSGTADLPLHGGSVPKWLADRMTVLGTAIAEHIIRDYGAGALLSRLADPFWFQALGAVLGMDWHSSGVTTSVLGALKRGVNPRCHELGMYVCGGRGRHSRQTPEELLRYADRTSLNGEGLVKSSRLAARVDNNAIGDGFQLYLHGFIVSASGEWTIVQQGMNAINAMARRYHWHSATIKDFVSEPHRGIVGDNLGTIMNLVDAQAKSAQNAVLETVRERPEVTLASVRKLVMPSHHDVRAADVDLKRLGAVLAVAHERELRDFASLLLVEKLGPRTLQSLALVAEVIHGTPTRFADPARFSFALGGKDGHPFPVPLKTYDETIDVLKRSLGSAKLGEMEKAGGFRRLEQFLQAVEETKTPQADLQATLARERAISHSLGGRTVFDRNRKSNGGSAAAKPKGQKFDSKQLLLF